MAMDELNEYCDSEGVEKWNSWTNIGTGVRAEEEAIRNDWIEYQTREWLQARIDEIEDKIAPEKKAIEDLERRIWLLRYREINIRKRGKQYKMGLEEYIRRYVLVGLLK